jgi:hypothetical protein
LILPSLLPIFLEYFSNLITELIAQGEWVGKRCGFGRKRATLMKVHFCSWVSFSVGKNDGAGQFIEIAIYKLMIAV